jgi:spore coat protein H
MAGLALLAAGLTACDRPPDRSQVPPQSDPPQVSATPAQTSRLEQTPPPEIRPDTVETRLPVYELKLDRRDLARLEQRAFSNETVPATFVARGQVYDQVRIRHRGDWARTWPKKPLKIFFDAKRPFEGRRRLNLNSAWRDPAFVRECLAYHLYAACGALAPTSQMVRVHLNGQFRGLYVEVEQPDKPFLNRVHLKGASLYKASSRSNQADERDFGTAELYGAHYTKETQKKGEGYAELAEFCSALARATNAVEFFTQRLDLDRYINFLAATVLCQNWDGFNKNHFLVYDGQGSKKWFVIPWDLDRTFGDHWNWSFSEARLPALLGIRQMPGVTGWNRVQDRFLSEPSLRGQFLDRLQALLQSEFTTEKLFPVLDQLEMQIGPEAVLDRQQWPAMGPGNTLQSGIAQIKRFIEQRRAYLLRELPRLRGNGV